MSQIKNYWKSKNQLEQNSEFKRFEEKEFQEGASTMEDPVSRRSFLKLMGASVGLAGVSGCNFRRPVHKIRPYVNKPEDIVQGQPLYYASTLNKGEEVVGVHGVSRTI